MPDSFDALPQLPTTKSRSERTPRRTPRRSGPAVEPPPETRAARGFRGIAETRELAAITLEAAVPWRILEMRRLTPEQRMHLAEEAADSVASHGDILMFPSKKKGATATVFNDLARGLAALAYQPGGVTVFGRHWCADPHPACPNIRRTTTPTTDRTETV